MANFFGVKNVFCYSGGTEATAMFPKVAETLQNQGFEILKLSETENPVYAIKFDKNEHSVICFLKNTTDFNPKSHFAAILTCDSADENCPIVFVQTSTAQDELTLTPSTPEYPLDEPLSTLNSVLVRYPKETATPIICYNNSSR